MACLVQGKYSGLAIIGVLIRVMSNSIRITKKILPVEGQPQ